MKYKIIISITLIFALVISVLFFFTYKDKETPNTFEEKSDDLQMIEQCNKTTLENLAGQWKYTGGATSSIPNLYLNQDNTFELVYSPENVTEAEGTWSFIEETSSIRLQIESAENGWDDIFNLNLDLFEGVTNYSLSERFIDLKISFIDISNEAEITCDTDKLSINFFNLFLYKK